MRNLFQFTKPLAASFCLGVLALSGCHKQPSAAAPAAPPPEAAASSAPAPAAPAAPQPQVQAPPPAPAQAAKPLPPPPSYVSANADNNIRQSIVGQVDGELTSALRAFVRKKNRMPTSFFEFTAAGLDSVPRPPAGKRWAIDTSDMTVKAVDNK
jgi:hypothetical protein